MPTSMMASFTKSSVPHTGQRYGYSMGGGPKGSSRSSLACGTSSCRRISSPTHRLALVIHHTVLRMPHLPHVHLMVAMRTAQRIATGTVTVTFPITRGRDDLDGTLDNAPHLRQGLLHQAFDLGKRLGRLHPVGAYPLETFRKHLLHPPTDKGVDIHAFPLHPLGLMRAIMVGDALTIITVDPSQGDRWTHLEPPMLRRHAARGHQDMEMRVPITSAPP